MEFVEMIISSDYSFGGRIMDIASWHNIYSSVRTDSRVFVENTEAVRTGKENTGRDRISIICSRETSEKITEDIYNEIPGLERNDISIYITPVNRPINGLPNESNEYQDITDNDLLNPVKMFPQNGGINGNNDKDDLDQTETQTLKDTGISDNSSENTSDSSENYNPESHDNITERPDNNLNNSYPGKNGPEKNGPGKSGPEKNSPDRINWDKNKINCSGLNGEGKDLMSQEKERLKAVYVIVEKGFSEDVIEAGEKAGTGGATIIPAEGNRSAANYVAPGLIINPHKEIVLIIAEEDKAEKLFEILSEEDGVLNRGMGIAYMTDIEKVAGLTKHKVK